MGTGDHLRDVQTGDAFPRSQATVNAWQRAARQGKAAERLQVFPPLRFPRGATGLGLIRNDSGSARDRFDVLGLDGVVFEPATALDQFKTDPVFKGVTPTTDHEGKFAILLEPLPADAFGLAMLAGVCCLEINVNDADDEYAEVSEETHYLLSSGSGSAEILWKESGTGFKWAQVRFPMARYQARWIRFVANGAFTTTDASVTVDGITYRDGYEPTDAVTTVCNMGKEDASYVFEGDDNDAGYALYDADDDKYYIWQMECP